MAQAVIIFGGIHPTVVPEEVLFHSCDYVVMGEGEYTFTDLCQQVKAGCVRPEKLCEVAFRNNGKTVYSYGLGDMVDLDRLPIFPYDMIDPAKYDLGYIISSRGCPHSCIYCSPRAISKNRIRYSSIDKIIEELDVLVNGFGLRSISFMDDYFAQNPQRVHQLCYAIRKAGFHMTCSFQAATRGDTVNREILDEMKSAGFTTLEFGAETCSEKVMKFINKGETVHDNVSGIRLAKEMGFIVEASFIFGLPFETHEDRVGALELAREIGIDRALFTHVTPYPGTELYRICHNYGRLYKKGDWENFSYVGALTNGFNAQLPYVPFDIGERELAGIMLLANLLFYLDFTKLVKLLNPSGKPSDKWFAFSLREMARLSNIIAFLGLSFSILLKAAYCLTREVNCRRFFVTSMRGKNKNKSTESIST